MLQIKQFVFGSFGTNTYVVSREGLDEVLIVDPACSDGYERQVLYAYVRSLGEEKRVRIAATHGHLDHLWGAAWACEQWHTEVLMHPADRVMAEAMQQQYALFGIRAEAQPFPIGDILQEPWEQWQMRVLETPGHTPGGVCLYWPEEKVLLSGDTLFRMGYGRTDLPGGDISQLIDSLERLMTLPADVRVYPGHGETTTIGAERR